MQEGARHCHRGQTPPLSAAGLRRCFAEALPDDGTVEYALGTHPGLVVQRHRFAAAQLLQEIRGSLCLDTERCGAEGRDKEVLRTGKQLLEELSKMRQREASAGCVLPNSAEMELPELLPQPPDPGQATGQPQ